MKWPYCEPPDSNDPYKGWTNVQINGIPYDKKEIDGKWQWVVDEKLLREKQQREQHRCDLYWALRSRILTSDEFKEVIQYGSSLNIDLDTPFCSEEKTRELNDALLQQFKMRLLSANKLES